MRCAKPAHRSYRPGTPDMDLIKSLEGFVAGNLGLLAPVDHAWQPTDFLPDLTADDWAEQLTRFRASVRRLSNDLVVVFGGEHGHGRGLAELRRLAQSDRQG